MKGKFLIYAIVVSLLSSVMSWGQFFRAVNKPSSGSSWSSRTSGGGGTWGNGTGGTWSGGGGGHK
jgi:acidic type I keratin